MPFVLVAVVGALVCFAFTQPVVSAILLLAAAPLRSLIAAEAPTLFPFDIGQVLLALLLASWAFHIFRRRRRLTTVVLPVAALVPVIGFLIASGLSLFTALSAHAWLTEWVKWLEIAAIIVIFHDIGRQHGWQWLAVGLIAAAGANAIVGVYQYYGGSGALHLVVEQNRFRAFGTFGQPNPFGGFMGLVVPLGMAYALSITFSPHAGVGQRRWKVVYAALIFVIASFSLYALYTSFSRGAWLAIAAALIVMAAALPRRPIITLLCAALLAFGITAAVASGRIPASILTRLSSVTQELTAAGDVRGVDITPENYANVERLAHWQAALNMAQAQPWTGIGFGNYEVAYSQFALLNWDFALGHAHNYYLNVFAEAGMIGGVAYIANLVYVALLTWRLRTTVDIRRRIMATGVLGAWAYLAIHSLTDNLYVNNLFFHIGALYALMALLREPVQINPLWPRNK